MNKRHRAELRAGLFVNLGAALLMLALFFFGSRLTLFWKPVRYSFTLEDAQGLITGSKVYVAGIDAGKVDHISLDRDTNRVRVDVFVSPDYRQFVRRDSHVELSTQGVLGDRVVLITPGSPSRAAIPAGGELAVRESPSLNHLVRNGDTLTHDLDRFILNINRFTDKLNSDIDLKKADSALGKLDSILGKVDNGKGTIGAFLNDPSLYDDTKALVGEANNNRIIRNLVRKSVHDANEAQAQARAKEKAEKKG